MSGVSKRHHPECLLNVGNGSRPCDCALSEVRRLESQLAESKRDAHDWSMKWVESRESHQSEVSDLRDQLAESRAEVERWREAVNDLSGFVSSADYNFNLKQETRDALSALQRKDG